jgi:phosphatidylserine/phosphatidylglycerophosphate/cardiolipin synthase-like enzyme
VLLERITENKKTISSAIQIVPAENYLPVLLALLDQAETSIDILAYSFAIGSARGVLNTKSAPYEIAAKIAEKKKQLGKKIQIRLYIEGTRETSSRNRVTAEFLKKAGVEVKYGATHAKGFCIDNKFLLFGSTNLTNQSILKNIEMNLLLTDAKSIAGFEIYFAHQWAGGRHGQIQLPPPLIADGGFKDTLIAIIDTAKISLEFSIYFFHYSEIELAFVRAHARGVKVTGLIHHHQSFALSYVKRTRGTANRLREKGIKDLHFGPGNLFTHSKFLICDHKEVLLGTGNWLHEDVKVHPQLYIHLKNASLAKGMAAELKREIKKITPSNVSSDVFLQQTF